MKIASRHIAILLLLPLGGFGQGPTFLDNPIALLREHSIKKITTDFEYNYNLNHNTEATTITYREHFYEEVYIMNDSLGYEEVIDSVWLTSDAFEVHYFNGDKLIDSSFYFSKLDDSLRTDTSRIIRYGYDVHGDLSIKIESSFWGVTVLNHEHYYWSDDRLDSIIRYSNSRPGIFGPVYFDTLQLAEKVNYVYDVNGRKLRKESWGKLKESYTYPTSNVCITIQTPHHPQSGCIVDNTFSYSNEQILEYNSRGLVERSASYYRSKKGNEAWERGEPFVYVLHYE